MSHYVNSYYSTNMDKFICSIFKCNNSGKTNMRYPACLASHTQYGGVQNDPPKIRIGVQVLNKFPPKGRGLGHVTPKNFGIQSNLSSKLLELQTLNLVHSFHLEKPSGRANNFPQKGRGLGHVTPQFLAYNRAYLQNYLS